MSTHPDLVLELVFGKKKQRKRIGVVLEVCTMLELPRLFTNTVANTTLSSKRGITN